MKRTGVATLIGCAVVGILVGALVQVSLAQSGQPGVTPPLTLGIVLALIGVIDLVLAWPIRKLTKGTAKAHVDPFYATRVVVLAKSSSMSGALLAGTASGLVLYLLTRSVPAVGSIGFSVATLVGAIVLMICGLVAEQMCKLPPEDREEKREKNPAEA